MNHWTLYFPYAIAFWLFFIGCFGISQSRNLIHTILCITVVQSSTYVLLLSIGFHAKAGAPIFSKTNPPGSPFGRSDRAGTHADRHRRRRNRDGALAGADAANSPA